MNISDENRVLLYRTKLLHVDNRVKDGIAPDGAEIIDTEYQNGFAEISRCHRRDAHYNNPGIDRVIYEEPAILEEDWQKMLSYAKEHQLKILTDSNMAAPDLWEFGYDFAEGKNLWSESATKLNEPMTGEKEKITMDKLAHFVTPCKYRDRKIGWAFDVENKEFLVYDKETEKTQPVTSEEFRKNNKILWTGDIHLVLSNDSHYGDKYSDADFMGSNLIYPIVDVNGKGIDDDNPYFAPAIWEDISRTYVDLNEHYIITENDLKEIMARYNMPEITMKRYGGGGHKSLEWLVNRVLPGQKNVHWAIDGQQRTFIFYTPKSPDDTCPEYSPDYKPVARNLEELNKNYDVVCSAKIITDVPKPDVEGMKSVVAIDTNGSNDTHFQKIHSSSMLAILSSGGIREFRYDDPVIEKDVWDNLVEFGKENNIEILKSNMFNPIDSQLIPKSNMLKPIDVFQYGYQTTGTFIHSSYPVNGKDTSDLDSLAKKIMPDSEEKPMWAIDLKNKSFIVYKDKSQ